MSKLDELAACKTGFEFLEAALRKYGFIGGRLTKMDEESIDGLLAALRARASLDIDVGEGKG